MQPNTLAVLDSIEHLGEIARLLLVLASRDKPRMEEMALIAACKRTSGLATRYPRPEPALALAIKIGLVYSDNGFVKLTERGHTFFSKRAAFGLEMTNPQRQFLLGALLDDPLVEEALNIFLGNFQPVRGKLLARKNAISLAPDQLLLCRILQQVGAIQISGDYYVFKRPFDQIVERPIIHSARLSQKDLLERLERQRKRGELAEEKVVELEKMRLLALKRPDLANKIERISVDNVSAGFDVKSFERDETLRFIEVKSSVGSKIAFEWSEAERAKARQEGSAYFIYFVPFSFSLPVLTAPVIAIRNPISKIAEGVFVEIPSNYKVREATIPDDREIRIGPIARKNRVSSNIVIFG
jgi:Domain of unknown function (DUF3883)